MSSGSFKELTKVINSLVPTATLPLPDDLVQIIQAYLDKHQPVEESDSQRLHDELLNVYQKEVKNKPDRYPIFIAILRQLRLAIAGTARILQWWDLLLVPILDHLAEEKGLAAETRGILLDLLVYDADDADSGGAANTSAMLSERLLEIWLNKSTAASSDADSASRFLEEQMKLVLMDFGKKRPKDFLVTIDKFFVKKEHRAQVLSFLCEFIRYGPPHLHQLLQTPLFNNLLRCLQVDTSTTVVSLAMTALTMFLPHIPNDIAQHLPSLFNIYCRILFWERERILPYGGQSTDLDPEKHPPNESEEKDLPEWDKLSYSFESDDETVPELLHYFTFLYGLYPINFMSYIRKPERYLRHANFHGEEDFEVQPSEIRQRSEPFREVHLLHPNFYTMTIESELTDPNRWMKSEAADVVNACMALCGPLYPGQNTQPGASERFPDTSRTPELDKDASDQPLLAQKDEQRNGLYHVSSEPNISWRNTTSTVVDSPDGSRRPSSAERKISHSQSIPLADSPTLGPLDMRSNSPTLPPQLLLTESQERLDQMQNQPFRGGLQQSFLNESQASFSSSQPREPSVAESYLQSLEKHQMPQSSLRPSVTEPDANIASLRREIMLLKNELNFERYLKQQHLSHIGQLRRKHVKEATVEAETQNLVNSNKRLRSKLEDAKNSMMQMKKESEKSRTHSKKWESELSVKLRALKEEQKKWNEETETLRRDLESSLESNNQLRQLVVTREAEELTSRQKVQSIEVNVDENERLRVELEKLSGTLHAYEAREIEIERAKTSEALGVTQVEILEMKVKAQENEINMMRLAANDEVEALRAEIEETRLDIHTRQQKGFQTMLDTALAVSRSRLAESERAHAHLLKKYRTLQGQYQAIRDHRNSDEPLLSGSGGHSQFDTESGFHSTGSPPPAWNNRRRGLSDPDVPDRISHSFGSPSEHTTTYFPIRPARTDTYMSRTETSTTRTDTSVGAQRSSSQEGAARSPSQGPSNVQFVQHNRSGSADSVQAGAALGLDPGGKPKIKPQSDIRVYGRGGVQNVGSTPKDKKKDKKKEGDDKKDKKGTGLRGIRAFA